MLHSRVQIDHLNWVVSLKDFGELIFYFEKLEIDEYAGLFWKGGDDSPSHYYVRSVEDNILPGNISPIKVIRKLIKEIISLVNRSKVNFFYFSPSTARKSKFYINVFMTYLHLLNGNLTLKYLINPID